MAGSSGMPGDGTQEKRKLGLMRKVGQRSCQKLRECITLHQRPTASFRMSMTSSSATGFSRC